LTRGNLRSRPEILITLNAQFKVKIRLNYIIQDFSSENSQIRCRSSQGEIAR